MSNTKVKEFIAKIIITSVPIDRLLEEKDDHLHSYIDLKKHMHNLMTCSLHVYLRKWSLKVNTHLKQFGWVGSFLCTIFKPPELFFNPGGLKIEEHKKQLGGIEKKEAGGGSDTFFDGSNLKK